MKLIYADTFSIGSFHETFNASSLLMFSEFYSDIVYRAPRSSKQCVEKLTGGIPANIKYKSLFLLGGEGHLGNFLRHLSSAVWNIIFVLLQKQDEVLYLNYNSLWATRIMNAIVKLRKTNVIIQCHGELEHLNDGIKLNVFSQAGLKMFADSRWKIADGLRFCVLGQSIYRNLPCVVSQKHLDRFISYEHPFIPHKVEKSEKKDNKIRIGTVGTIRQYKGLDQLLTIGKALKDNPDVSFYALGRVDCSLEDLAAANIQFIPGAENDYVSKEVLNSYIDSMDMLIFTYPVDKYKFTASGALFDAIDREKVILSLHNDYFDEMFRRVNIGRQFSSIEEMITFLKACKGNNICNVNFAEAKQTLSYKTVAKEFKSVLSSLNLL